LKIIKSNLSHKRKKELEVLLKDLEKELPDSERWIHSPLLKQNLNEALNWAEKTPPSPSNLAQLKLQRLKTNQES
jgi:hypothetical protein